MRKQFWKWVAKRAAKYAGIPLRDPALVAMLGHRPAASGVDVTEVTALNTSAVYAAVRLLAQSVASLPLGVVQKSNKVQTELTDHSLNWTLQNPNPEMTAFDFVETVQAHVEIWGNGFARIMPGDPVTLWPILPNQMQPHRHEETGGLYYQFQAMFPGEESADLEPSEVLHIHGLGFDGLVGYSPIQRAREAIGLSLALEQYGGSFFGNGVPPAGYLKHPGELDKAAVKNLRESWEELHKERRLAILDEGMEYVNVGIPPEEAQFLGTREFQIVEVARWYGVPPHMLYDLRASTKNNMEQQGLEFLTYSLLARLLKWQQEMRRKLFTFEEQRAGLLVDHDVSVFLKTDVQARYTSYQTGLQGGWLTLNNVAQKENLPPIPSVIGDARGFPENMRLFGADGQEIQRTKSADEAKELATTLAILQAVTAGQITANAGKLLLKDALPDSDAIVDQSVPGAQPAAPGAVDGAPVAEKQQDLALNGAQIASLLTVLQAVAAGQLELGSAKQMIVVSFPNVAAEHIDAMLAPYVGKAPIAPSATNPSPEHGGRGASPPGNDARALRIPDIHQTDGSSCGLACFRSVLSYYGVEEQQGDAHPDGLKPGEIADLARAHGLNCLAGPLGMSGLRRQLGMGRPVICPIQAGNPDGSQSGHYVVVRGIAGQTVQINDPAYGPMAINRDAFLERWHDIDRDGAEYEQFGIIVWK